jgi:hypothetical protein
MTTTSKRVLHHLTTRGGERLALCSTAEARIIRPVVANRAYVTCPRCNAILGKKAEKPRTVRTTIGGLPKSDGAAMTEAKIALGVKKRPAPNPDRKKKPPKPQIDGQRDIFAELGDDGGDYEWMTR